MNREMRENLCDTCRKGCKVRREAIVSSCESYKAPKEAAKLKGEGTEEKPFNEKYGLEIAGKFVPFKDLPTDINELKDLIKTAEEKGLEIMLTASGLGHRNCEYKMFNQTNKVSITEVEWLILCEILDIKDKLISLGAVNSAEKKERT